MAPHALTITSPDIEDGQRIGDRFAGEHGAQTPRIEVAGIPDGAVELALICHDPDAPRPDGFTHWVLYGLPPAPGAIDALSGRAGPNDAGRRGYVGPYPPPGHGEHRYYFWVYALSRVVEGEPTRRQFINFYGDAVLEQARLVGTYSV